MPNKRPETGPSTDGSSLGFAIVGLAAIVCWRFSSVLANLETSFVDFEMLHGPKLLFELFDTRLNAWILSWDMQVGLSEPWTIYDTNAFHPARNTLTGSEHLFGLALQVLPLRIFTQNAIALHQLALVGSSALFGLTTLFATRWVTGSNFAGFLAGAFALSMPWRMTELSHLQLASVQFFPLVWMSILHLLLGRAKRLELVFLSAALALQLLTSFYLAYFLSLSSLVLVAIAGALRPPRWQDLTRLALLAAPGYLLLGLSAIPYLQRQGDPDFVAQAAPHSSFPLDFVLAYLAPRWPYGWSSLNAPASYWTPWAVVVLASIAVFSVLRVGSSDREIERVKLRIATLSLVAIVCTSALMMLGARITIAGAELALPSSWLRDWVPGFSMLRGSTRWGILAGIALPMLAGIGASAVERRFAAKAGSGAKARLIWGRGALVLICALTVSWVPLPTRPVWDPAQLVEQRYSALSKLPFGPAIELPWANAGGYADHGSRALLGSTLHWRPILNGYTGHPPGTFPLLHRIAQRLPDRAAVAQLSRLSGLRWIVVDWKRSVRDHRRQWSEAVRQGWLRRVHADPSTQIFEYRDWRLGGDLIPALRSREQRPRTFRGFSRAPLELPVRAGELRAEFGDRHPAGFWVEARLQLDNRSALTWPGFDLDEEGLIQLRYSYQSASGDQTTVLVPLDVDVPPNTSVKVQVMLRAPDRPGPYEICLDLVQIRQRSIRRLPIRSLVRNVAVIARSERDEFLHLIASSAVSPTQPLACERDE